MRNDAKRQKRFPLGENDMVPVPVGLFYRILYCLRVVRREILDVFHSSLWVEGLHMRQKRFPLEENDMVPVAVGLFYRIGGRLAYATKTLPA